MFSVNSVTILPLDFDVSGVQVGIESKPVSRYLRTYIRGNINHYNLSSDDCESVVSGLKHLMFMATCAGVAEIHFSV